MGSLKHRLMAAGLAASVALTSTAVSAEEYMANSAVAEERPSAGAMLGDAMFARPALLVGTLFTTAAFVVSLPFSILGRNVNESAQMLVIGPAKATFLRCMGCTEAQDKWFRAQRNIRRAAVATSAPEAVPAAAPQP